MCSWKSRFSAAMLDQTSRQVAKPGGCVHNSKCSSVFAAKPCMPGVNGSASSSTRHMGCDRLPVTSGTPLNPVIGATLHPLRATAIGPEGLDTHNVSLKAELTLRYSIVTRPATGSVIFAPHVENESMPSNTVS